MGERLRALLLALLMSIGLTFMVTTPATAAGGGEIFNASYDSGAYVRFLGANGVTYTALKPGYRSTYYVLDADRFYLPPYRKAGVTINGGPLFHITNTTGSYVSYRIDDSQSWRVNIWR